MAKRPSIPVLHTGYSKPSKLKSTKLETINKQGNGVSNTGTKGKMGVPGSSNQPIYGTIKKQTNPVSLINLGCWNIRRGLVKRELEIIDLINSNNLAVLFLVETDSHLINEKKDFGLYCNMLPQ